MPVEGWQLAAAGLGIMGVAAAGARHYFGSFDLRIKELEDRQRIADMADAAHRTDMANLTRRLDEEARRAAASGGELLATVSSLANDVRGLMVAMGRLDERLDIKKEMRGMLGRRAEDREGNA